MFERGLLSRKQAKAGETYVLLIHTLVVLAKLEDSGIIGRASKRRGFR
jgi:hypothetical protein